MDLVAKAKKGVLMKKLLYGGTVVNVFTGELERANVLIENEKIVQLPLIFDLPEGVVCSEKSKEYIEITITKK